MEEELKNLKPRTRIVAFISLLVAIGYSAYHVYRRFHFSFWIGLILLWLIIFKTQFVFSIWGLMFSYWIILDSILPIPEAYILSLLFIYIFYGMYNMNHFRVKKYDIIAPFDLDIIQLSDLHIGSGMNFHAFEKAFVSMQSKNPDVIVITGDLVDESTYEQEFIKMMPLLTNLQARLGKYYIYGNHDCTTSWQQEKLDCYMKQCGFTLLCDSSIVFDDFTLIGRNDAFKTRKSMDLYPTSSYTIVLDHQPVDLYMEAENQVDLTLCGHTHNGQIWPMGWMDRLLKENDLVYGHKIFGTMHAIVTSGLGGWGYPIRTQGHSEYVWVQLKKEQ